MYVWTFHFFLNFANGPSYLDCRWKLNQHCLPESAAVTKKWNKFVLINSIVGDATSHPSYWYSVPGVFHSSWVCDTPNNSNQPAWDKIMIEDILFSGTSLQSMNPGGALCIIWVLGTCHPERYWFSWFWYKEGLHFHDFGIRIDVSFYDLGFLYKERCRFSRFW